MTKRVVLAYSGGLDTSVAVRWMREQWDVEVVCCAVDVGQLVPGEEEAIRERARAAGAVEIEVIDDGHGHQWGSGVGTLSMRERAEELGGTCQRGPGPDGGLVRALIPIGTS